MLTGRKNAPFDRVIFSLYCRPCFFLLWPKFAVFRLMINKLAARVIRASFQSMLVQGVSKVCDEFLIVVRNYIGDRFSAIICQKCCFLYDIYFV